MKIGIDASRAFGEERTGTEEYSYQLLRHLAVLPAVSSHQIFLYVREGARMDFELPSNFMVREIRGDFLWTRLRLSWELRKHPVDVLFVPAHTLPSFVPRKSVVTIHGLEHRSCGDCYSRKDRLVLEMNTRLSIFLARRIIVPSKSTKKDIVEYYKVAPERVSVIHHGAPEGRAATERADSKGGFDILFIGRLEKRKNIARMVRAFGKFRKKLGGAEEGRKIRLILAGKDGFGSDRIREGIDRSDYKGDILIRGYVSEKEKEELYGNADVFLFPTLAEGFGLPVLEAMSHGVPVIASRVPALAEVAGTGALLVDPTDEEEIADALLRYYKDESAREESVGRGYEDLRRFSWEKCAEETWKVIAEWGAK